MKENAPEKLYLHPTARGDVGASWLTFPLTDNDIEYIRTDVFINKACDWLKENAGDYVVHHWNETMLDTMSLIEDFKEYMEGE